MKNYVKIILPFSFMAMAFVGSKPAPYPCNQYTGLTDTLPDVCTVLPGNDIAALQPFDNPLSSSFPDPNSTENYSGCHYQFYKPGETPQLAVRLIKWASKNEAASDFTQQMQSHFDNWGIAPERITGVADSAYFGYNTGEPNLCDECGLVAIQGPYAVYISFKGQYEKITRTWKKEVALQILQMMYDRIPGLRPSRIRNKQ